MRLSYLVQQSDGSEKFGKEGFDFGGINGGIAQFMAKGDAILFAQELQRRCPELSVRVLCTAKRNSPEVFRSNADVVLDAGICSDQQRLTATSPARPRIVDRPHQK